MRSAESLPTRNTMFTLYEDPLAWSRPFPVNALTSFQAHWHEVLGLFLFYCAIQAASPWVSKAVVGNAYTGLNAKTKLNFDIHVVSMVQCIILIVVLIPSWGNEHFQNRASDPYGSIFGYNEYLGFVVAITIGYFIWDLIVCLMYIRLFGAGFLLHAFAALYVFGVALIKPYCMPWVPAFLLFELSTPFVNVNWFSSRLPAGTVPDKLVIVNGLLLLVVFFLVRIAWGFYAVGLVAYDMYRTLHMTSLFMPASILILNFSLDVLNVYWFMKMVAIAKKKAGGAKTRPVSKEAAKYE